MKTVDIVVTDWGNVPLDDVPVPDEIKAVVKTYPSWFHRPWYWRLMPSWRRWRAANKRVLEVATNIARRQSGYV